MLIPARFSGRMVPNKLRDLFDRNVSILKVPQGVFFGASLFHSSLFLCSLQGKGDDRSSKGEGQGDSNRFKGKSCHGVLHDRLTKWIKACLSKMEYLCSFFCTNI